MDIFSRSRGQFPAIKCLQGPQSPTQVPPSIITTPTKKKVQVAACSGFENQVIFSDKWTFFKKKKVGVPEGFKKQ